MVTVFIICDNSTYQKHLFKKICESQINVQIVGLESKITIYTLKNCILSTPDVIISKKGDQTIFRKYLKFAYIPVTIYDQDITLEKTTRIINQLKKLSLNTMYSHKETVSNYKKKAHQKIVQLKFNPHLSGTCYLLDCIVSLQESPYSSVTYNAITKQIAKVAKKYNTTSESVISDIRATIEEMYKCTSSDFRKKIYGTATYINYPTLIKAIYQKIIIEK